MTTATSTRRIEVFRPGTFTPMNGTPVTFSADDLRAIAAAYDGVAAPAPAVVGHPRTDDPAYGWASAFSYDEDAGRLVAELDRVHPEFERAVRDGSYRRISLSLFSPSAPNNPKPGTFYPKHIGFLGAAAPAVPGLAPVAFSADDEGTLTFEFSQGYALREISGVFSNIREWIIGRFGLEEADRIVPKWSVSSIAEAAAEEISEDRTPLGFADPATIPEKDKPMNDKPGDKVVTELEAREAAVAAREAALAHAENLSFAESLISEGRILPALKDKVVGLLDGLVAGRDEVSFAEGGTSKTATPVALVKDILTALPVSVSFGAVEIGNDGSAAPVEFAMPDGMRADPVSADLHARALAHQARHPGTDYMTAVAAVNR